MTKARNHAAAVAISLLLLLAGRVFAQEPNPVLQIAPTMVTIGDLTITQAWSRATPPGAATGAGYLTITNNGTTNDRLIAVISSAAEIVGVHEMRMVNDRMTMRPIEGGLAIPPGEAIVLQPGGIHLMLNGVGDGLVEGAVITATLSFEIAGTAVVELIVLPIGSPGPVAMPEMEMNEMGDAP